MPRGPRSSWNTNQEQASHRPAQAPTRSPPGLGLGRTPERVGPHPPLFVYESCCPVTKKLSEELWTEMRNREWVSPPSPTYCPSPSACHLSTLRKAWGWGWGAATPISERTLQQQLFSIPQLWEGGALWEEKVRQKEAGTDCPLERARSVHTQILRSNKHN